ncbi:MULTISPECIES: hypothetical protein [unclassified Actinoplanes]|uniref:hypothetical protein n=1 Tax=unclassified Actinoplanes TaxID=2626549 RepID=UPI0012BAE440|nr:MULTISPECIES: hypothetical protein [unclassified Actinoplanes]
MRYLTRNFAVGALRRGGEVEQFLSADDETVRWVSVRPAGEGFLVVVHRRQSLGDPRFGDLPSLPPPPAGFEFENVPVARAAGPEEALSGAELAAAARPDRWVNCGVAGDDCREFLRARWQSGGGLIRRWPGSSSRRCRRRCRG